MTPTYNAAGQLAGLIAAKSDGTVISRSTYTYDTEGNRTAMAHYDGAETARPTQDLLRD